MLIWTENESLHILANEMKGLFFLNMIDVGLQLYRNSSFEL